MRAFRALIMLSLLAAVSCAAFIYGDIYDSNLERLNKTAIQVEGRFSYMLVTERGNYSLFLPDGDYKLSASAFDGAGEPAFYTEEQVSAGAADQRVDLVLKPVKRDASGNIVYAALAALALGAFALAFYLNHRRAGQNQEPEATEEAPKPIKAEPDEGMKSVLRALESQDGRATQKELKEALGFSDAKLSLILSELEHSGYVKKFKRGRGNIVRKL